MILQNKGVHCMHADAACNEKRFFWQQGRNMRTVAMNEKDASCQDQLSVDISDIRVRRKEACCGMQSTPKVAIFLFSVEWNLSQANGLYIPHQTFLSSWR